MVEAGGARVLVALLAGHPSIQPYALVALTGLAADPSGSLAVACEGGIAALLRFLPFAEEVLSLVPHFSQIFFLPARHSGPKNELRVCLLFSPRIMKLRGLLHTRFFSLSLSPIPPYFGCQLWCWL